MDHSALCDNVKRMAIEHLSHRAADILVEVKDHGAWLSLIARSPSGWRHGTGAEVSVVEKSPEQWTSESCSGIAAWLDDKAAHDAARV